MEIIALCRAGFEKEVAAELSELAAVNGLAGYAKTNDRDGYVEFIFYQPEDAVSFIENTPFRQLIFIRHWFIAQPALTIDDVQDRVTPLAEQLQQLLTSLQLTQLDLIEPVNLDTNDGKSLQRLATGVSGHLGRSLGDLVGRKSARYRGQLLMLAGNCAFVGVYPKANVSPWLAGVPRLRQPKAAPSRATLKLEEAWHHFIPKTEWDQRLAASMTAVDLGAAPGGWTWQLVNRSMFVQAVDNGPMAESLMESGQVTHHMLDGFAFKPDYSVDWLVCDIADKPARVADMIRRWALQGWCREAVFNLKLPMKQRYLEVKKCSAMITEALTAVNIAHELRFKQLYHDREEVTGHLRIL